MMLLVRKIRAGTWVRLFRSREELADKMRSGDFIGKCPDELEKTSQENILKFAARTKLREVLI